MRKIKLKKLISGMIAAVMVTGSVSPVLPAVAAANPTLTVDMAAEYRELEHGATGWLYGQGDDEVPTANTITALKPNTAVQKAPNGMQHPNGDVLDIANTFLNAGGKNIQIYVPDYYALWFYEFTGTDYYLDILRMQAQACIDAGIEDDVVYVLYNEPSSNWVGTYHDGNGNTTTGWNSTYWFWKDMVEALREVYLDNGIQTQPKTAGLNLAAYDNTIMENYIKFCVENDCMPDIISWHDLSTWQFNIFGQEYNHYRSLEAKYGIEEPREIVINEYAAQSECASPGNLVRWIGLFEDYEVAGCLPFWHFSNNLNGLAADNNTGNGAWWLYKWYGDMSGSYLPVSVSNANKSDFYGAASIDENKKSASVIFGGKSGDADIVLDSIGGTQTFHGAGKVHIKVEATDYTGFHGAAEEPRVVKEGVLEVVDGKVTVPMSDMNAMSGYRITVTQASEDDLTGLLSSTWKALYEAEDGARTGSAIVGTADGSYACSNRKKVNSMNNPGDSVTLTVDVPKSGYYKYDMVYCAATGVSTSNPKNNTPYTAIQTLTIDGGETIDMELPNTLHWSMGGMYSTYIQLSAGTHALKIEATASNGKATPDCVYLTYKGSKESDTQFDMTYEAELGEFNEIKDNNTTLTTMRDGSTGYITGLEQRTVTNGGGVRFNVVVPDNGMYTLSLRYLAQKDTTANIYVDNDMVNLDRLRTQIALKNTNGAWLDSGQEIFLQKGINVIDIDTKDAVKLDSMQVKAVVNQKPVIEIEAEDGELTGEAEEGTNSDVRELASGGGYVSGLKASNGVELIPEDDADFTILGLGRQVDLGNAVDANSLVLNVNVSKAGQYKLVVYQSSGELFGKHDYNAQMSERYASFSVNNGAAKKVVFRNTYSDETFCSQVVDVTLKAGSNTVKIYNDNSKVVTNGVLKAGQSAHRPENIDYNVLDNYTPNFDKFQLYSVTGKAVEGSESTYKVTASASAGGQVSLDKNSVEKGGRVQVTFRPDSNACLKNAYVNGVSVMDKLNAAGGVYLAANVQENLEIKAYFETEEAAKVIVKQSGYEYAVNAGDINPATLSEGDSFGVRQSVTEQFYGADPETGYQWGVDDTYQADTNYPGWLTGVKTWPCENDGATDASPKEKSFRYARGQAVTDVGIVYKFALEADQSYDVEMGFYVPGNWTNESNPRTMKLLFNDTAVSGYESFTASNDSDNPYIINTTATADAGGQLKIQIGHAANAVWGPVISYINILRSADKTELQSAVTEHGDYIETNYSVSTWTTFRTALNNAETVLAKANATMAEICDALYQLEVAAQNLKAVLNTDSLKSLRDEYMEYAEKTGQSMTSDEDWNEFLEALLNVDYVVTYQCGTQDYLDSLSERLSKAAEKLRIAKRIEVTKLPTKTSYYVGETFDASGLIITAYDTKDEKKVLSASEYNLSGHNNLNSAGTKTITVTYLDLKATFNVTVTVKPVVTLPKITNITAKLASYNSIQLSWNKISQADGYEIYRSTSKNGSYSLVKTIQSASTLKYKDTKRSLNKTYYYKVRAFKKTSGTTVRADFSKIVYAKTKLAVPKVTLRKLSSTSLKVTWKKVGGANGYQVKYSLKKKSGYKTVPINKAGKRSYTKTGLKKGKTYFVRVRAYRKVNGNKIYGSWSKPKNVKLK